MGNKTYELTNHLGNVMETVSDLKLGIRQERPVNHGANYYIAQVLSANDYYAFGMLMPDRQYTATAYRYGFNNKERDDEVAGSGNQYDYGFRISDPRKARFLSVDPLARSYAGWSPYAFAMNRPIDGIDIDGLEWIKYRKWTQDYDKGGVLAVFANITVNTMIAVPNAIVGAAELVGHVIGYETG